MLNPSLSSSKGRNVLAIVRLMLDLFPLDSLLFRHNLCPMVIDASENGDPFGLFRFISTIAEREVNAKFLWPNPRETRHSPRNVLVEFDFDFAIRYISRVWS